MIDHHSHRWRDGTGTVLVDNLMSAAQAVSDARSDLPEQAPGELEQLLYDLSSLLAYTAGGHGWYVEREQQGRP